MAVSFIGEGNQSTQRKPATCHKSLDKLYHIMPSFFMISTIYMKEKVFIFHILSIKNLGWQLNANHELKESQLDKINETNNKPIGS